MLRVRIRCGCGASPQSRSAAHTLRLRKFAAAATCSRAGGRCFSSSSSSSATPAPWRSATGISPDQEGSKARQQLERDGFCVLRDVFDLQHVADMNSTAAELATEQSSEAAERQQYTGSLISLTSHPVFVELLTSTPAAFQQLGAPFADARFMNGYVISKPGRGRRLYWHQDWWGWDNAASYGDVPPMFALMTYLTATRAPCGSDPGNGCLRVLPGTHRRRHHLHNRVPDAHGDEVSLSAMGGPAFDDVAEAVDVPMQPGDVALVDVRVLHATRDNDTDERRSMITCWWVPHGEGHAIPPQWQSEFAAQTTDNPHDQGEPAWSAEEVAAVQQLYCEAPSHTRYHGGPPGQPHQPGTGPGFELAAGDLADPTFRYFGSGRGALVEVRG